MIKNPIHPGEIIREICIEGAGITVSEAAQKLGVDRTTLSRLLNGHAGISPEMAMRLSMALGNNPTLWMNLQRDYDLWKLKSLARKLHVEKFKSAA
ncbi:MAG: HigA family addiction module antitoxin [Gammaproteobacteria bacterium]|nr:HigA family addiction module antitoxin [Gammaproteobacteria bacterium]